MDKPMRRSRLVNFDDTRRHFLSGLEDVFDFVRALFADLRDMHQAVNVVLQADEGAEAGQLGHVACDQIAHLVELVDAAPGIDGQLFHTHGNALVGLVHFQHHRLHFVALLEHFGRMIDLARPGNVRDMDHAVQAFFQFDEGAVAG